MYSCADTSSIVLGRLPRKLSVVIKNQRKIYIYTISQPMAAKMDLPHIWKCFCWKLLSLQKSWMPWLMEREQSVTNAWRGTCGHDASLFPRIDFIRHGSALPFPTTTIPNPLNRWKGLCSICRNQKSTKVVVLRHENIQRRLIRVPEQQIRPSRFYQTVSGRVCVARISCRWRVFNCRETREDVYCRTQEWKG